MSRVNLNDGFRALSNHTNALEIAQPWFVFAGTITDSKLNISV